MMQMIFSLLVDGYYSRAIFRKYYPESTSVSAGIDNIKKSYMSENL